MVKTMSKALLTKDNSLSKILYTESKEKAERGILKQNSDSTKTKPVNCGITMSCFLFKRTLAFKPRIQIPIRWCSMRVIIPNTSWENHRCAWHVQVYVTITLWRHSRSNIYYTTPWWMCACNGILYNSSLPVILTKSTSLSKMIHKLVFPGDEPCCVLAIGRCLITEHI